MPKNRRFLRRAAALILAVLLLAAAMPSALAADTRTGTVSAPTGILLLLASPGGEAAGEVPDGSAVSILSEETDANGTLWYYIQKPGGETGYVPAESVTLSEPETTPTPEETRSPPRRMTAMPISRSSARSAFRRAIWKVSGSSTAGTRRGSSGRSSRMSIGTPP